MSKIKPDFQDEIISQYGMKITHTSVIPPYTDFTDLVKVSQNLKSFDLGGYFYLNLPDLKNYLIWSNRTDSKRKTICRAANAYFAILSLFCEMTCRFCGSEIRDMSETCPKKTGHVSDMSRFLGHVRDMSPKSG